MLVAAISSCLNKKETIRKEYYSNGSLKSEITYIGDSIKQGKALYYDSGRVLEKEEYYRNGKLDSLSIDYYPNGKIKLKCLLCGSACVHLFSYDTNGTLRTYNANDGNEQSFYVLKYDSLGKKIKEEGFVICPAMGVLDDNNGYYHENDTIHSIHWAAQPLGYKTNVYIALYRINELLDSIDRYKESNKRVVESYKKYEFIKNVIQYTTIVKEKGQYQIRCAGELIDNNNNLLNRDTTGHIIYVK